MKRPDQDRLLQELLAGEESSEFRQASLDRALASIRRRRQVRQVASMCAVMALMGLLVWQVATSQRSTSGVTQVASNTAPIIVVQAPQVKVQYINDEELLALFPDRPVALIGKPGKQRLVFLDQPVNRAN